MRVGLLTSGGDCQALNATMRAIVQTLSYQTHEQTEFYGFLDGYHGLVCNQYKRLTKQDLLDGLIQGGTILGTSRMPFKQIDEPMEDGTHKVPAMIQTYQQHNLDCLFVLGGNGSTKTANRLREEGLNIIALPKTIDNDTWGTDLTFGFTSAIEIVTRYIDDIRTTATSHGRVFVIEAMGHKVGWIPLYAGIAGGADVILIPEIPYDMKRIVAAIEHDQTEGERASIVLVAEGALSKSEAKLTKKEYKALLTKREEPSVAYVIARELERLTDREVRVGLPGHSQRGGAPDAQDRLFATQCGIEAAEAALEGKYGILVAQKKGKMCRVPLDEVAGKLKYVNPKGEMVKEARYMGISFGDA